MPVHLLIIGETTRADSAPLVDWVASNLQPTQQQKFPDFDQAIGGLSGTGWIPDLVIVIQCWPDEFSGRDLDRLFAFAPLARLTVCYGPWCESDGRTRQGWPLAARVPMHSAPTRLLQEWQLVSGAPVTDLIPLSASREEVFAADHADLKMTSGLTIAVDSPDPAYQAYLIEFLRNCGVSAAPISSPEVGCDAILFDSDPPEGPRLQRLMTIRQHHASKPVIALLSSPNSQTIEKLKDYGAATAVAKLGDQQRILDAIRFIQDRTTRL